jgi:hypothetical protein
MVSAQRKQQTGLLSPGNNQCSCHVATYAFAVAIVENLRCRQSVSNFGNSSLFNLPGKIFGGQMVVTKVVSWWSQKKPDRLCRSG